MENAKAKNKKPVYKRWWFWIIMVFVVGLIGNAIPDSQSIPESDNDNQIVAIWDVATLISSYATVDDVCSALGAPYDSPALREASDLQMTLGVETWTNEWHKDNHVLLVTYDISTRNVVDYFIDSGTEAEYKNTDLLLPLVNLEKYSDLYSLKPVKALKDLSIYTGVTIIPR